MDIKAYLKEKKNLVDSFLESYFKTAFKPKVLHDSVVYSISAGGKRIRPILCLAAYEACGGKAEDIVPYASAIELIHTYSLIHDDLPAMDNDDLRRGKPTNHKVFGEGMAILAGDALLTEAFSLIAECGMGNLPSAECGMRSAESRDRESKIQNPKSKIGCLQPLLVLKVIRELALASGMHGMVGGQAQDLLSERAEPDKETLSFIHTHKTAALIIASVRAGGLLAGCADDMLQRLTEYGENIGLVFQVIDDILDVKGDTKLLGKTAGSDERNKKMTYPGLYGLDLSRRKAEELIANAVNALEPFPDSAVPLREIARYILLRKN